MQINSNIIQFKNTTQEYKAVESVLEKIASSHNIDNVEKIDISLSQKEGIIRFKKSELGQQHLDSPAPNPSQSLDPEQPTTPTQVEDEPKEIIQQNVDEYNERSY